jgi:glycosyltransferase involved in cell wall biosynthesis
MARGYVWSLLSFLPALQAAIRIKPDILVADHTNAFLLTLFLKVVRYPAKAVYRNHGAGFLIYRPRLARFALAHVDHVITVSQPEADALKQLTNRPVTLVPNCLPAHCLAPRKPQPIGALPQGPTIAYVGWLSRAKGIYDFMDLFKEIRKTIPCTQGIAIGRISLERGSTDSSEELLACMRASGVRYLGEMPRESLFRGVDFLLVSSSRESFGLTIIEAPFCGVIPIAYDSPGTHFLLDGVNECLIPNGKREQMAQAVLELWERPVRRSEIEKLLRERFLRDFGEDLIATKLIAAFQNS